MAANPFGRNAFAKQEKSRLVVPVGKPLRLRFAVQFHSQPLAASEPLPPVQQLVRAREQGYRDYLKILHIGSGVR